MTQNRMLLLLAAGILRAQDHQRYLGLAQQTISKEAVGLVETGLVEKTNPTPLQLEVTPAGTAAARQALLASRAIHAEILEPLTFEQTVMLREWCRLVVETYQEEGE